MQASAAVDDTSTTRTDEAVRPPSEEVPRAAERVVAALAQAQRTGSRDAWLAVAARCQSLVNSASAVQDVAIVEVARRENVWLEDGTLGETEHGPGRVAIDAADLVAPVLGTSHPQAQRRVEQAVRLAGARVPVEADSPDRPAASGLDGLHRAMGTGRLDGYRASVIAFELEVAPAHVARAVVSALEPHLGDDAPGLRRRTRLLLSRISPDLVRERAKRARAATGLRRWVAEPGVDEWHGTFPSEDAAVAWAAIDRLAHDLVANGTCTNLEQARGKALTDLVTGNADIDVHIVLTVPADAADSADALAGCASTPGTATTTSSPSADDIDTVAPGTAAAEATSRSAVTPGILVTGAADAASNSTPAQLPPAPPTLEGPVTLSPSRAAAAASATTAQHPVPSTAPMTAAGSTPDDRDDDLVEVHGARPSEPLLVRRGWLRDHLPKTAPRSRSRSDQPPRFVPCDPLTGARLDPRDDLATVSYHPPSRLAALVRARDGRCRFPSCCVPARSCDLDHVRPWPTGPTSARNLLTLCRRHHRIKQRPGWRVTLTPDGAATWTDPSGRERTTLPLDALAVLVLTDDPLDSVALTRTDDTTSASATTTTGERYPHTTWSGVETHLALALEHHTPSVHLHPVPGIVDLDLGLGLGLDGGLPGDRNRSTHRRCTSATQLRQSLSRRTRPRFPDQPPF